MFDTIKVYILIFFAYSFIGWVIETILQSSENKKFVNRGFLLGPVCPIHGFAVLAISFLLKKYEDDLLVTFFLSIIICGLIEYTTSYFMEKIFKARWWDYTQMKFNINGRVCLEYLLCFGIGCTLAVFVINPFFKDVISFIPSLAQTIIVSVLSIIFIVDIIVSLKVVANLKLVSTEIKDNTVEISEKVKKIVSDNSIVYTRLINAFPNIKDIIDFKKWTQKIQEKIDSVKKEK